MRFGLTRDWLSPSEGRISVTVESAEVEVGAALTGIVRAEPARRWRAEGGLVLTLLEVWHGPHGRRHLPLRPYGRLAVEPQTVDEKGAQCAFSVHLPSVMHLERQDRWYVLEAAFPDIESRTAPGQVELRPRLPAVFAPLEAAVLAAGDLRRVGHPGRVTTRQGRPYHTFGYVATRETRALVDGVVFSLAFEPDAVTGWVTVDRRERTVRERVRAPFTDEDKRAFPLRVPHDRLNADPESVTRELRGLLARCAADGG